MLFTAASAEIIGLKALEWLAAEDDLFMTFLGSSGADLKDVQNGASDPAFLGSVLDFILMDDQWVQDFCNHATLEYDAPYAARQFLPGGEIPNWT